MNKSEIQKDEDFFFFSLYFKMKHKQKRAYYFLY